MTVREKLLVGRRGWRPWMVKVLMVCGAGGVSILAGGSSFASSPVLASPITSVEAQVTVGPVSADLSVTSKPLGQLGKLDGLNYAIRTHYNSGSGCAGERLRTARIGVPTPVDMGGSMLPDATVTLVAVPSVSGSPDLLQLAVSKTAVGTLRGRIEVILAAADSGRVSFGYNACETGAPLHFSATIGATDARISLEASTSGPTAALTIIGSAFDEVGGVATDPTALALRLAPVPALMSANVDIIGPSSYKGSVTTSTPTKLRLGYSDLDGASRMSAVATIETFPGQLDLTFNKAEITYSASARVERVGLSLTSFRPAAASAPPARTQQLTVDLLDVPKTARLLRTTPTRLMFTTPGTVSSATVHFASYESGVTLPALTRFDGQYLVANVSHRYSQAEVRLLGLSRADVDAGDPVLVDVTHTAGPFRVVAKVTGNNSAQPPVEVTRDLDVRVRELPATAKVTYSPTSQVFTYDGSAPIVEMDVDVISSVPFVDEATTAHLTIRDFPTGLRGQLDTDAKTFTAALTGGSVRLLELRVASPGFQKRLPDGVDGVLLEDHDGSYVAFARISGLQQAKVGWGDTQSVEVVHTAGPFVLAVDIDDPDATEPGASAPTDIDLEVEMRDLPAKARFEYTPGEPLPGPCDQAECGHGPTSLSFTGDATVARLMLHMVSGSPIVPSGRPGFVGANEAHVVAWGIPPSRFGEPGQPEPPGVALVIDGTEKALSAEVAGDGQGLVVHGDFCSSGPSCGRAADPGISPPQPAAPDGLSLVQLVDDYHLVARLSGVRSVGLRWNDPIVVQLEHTPGPFDIDVRQRFYGGEFGEVQDDSTTTVRIRDLPASLRLEYSEADQHIDYTGSAQIGSIEAWHHRATATGADGGVWLPTDWPGAIAGRATEAHLRVLGLPPHVDLGFDFGETGQKLSLCTAVVTELGACVPFAGETEVPTIQRLEMELFSSPELFPLDPNQDGVTLAGGPLMAPGPAARDGLALWDLDDFDTTKAEPVEDGYLIVARITDLQSILYDKQISFGDNGSVATTSVDLVRPGAPGLWVEAMKPDETKVSGVEYVVVDYPTPPDTMGFVLEENVTGLLSGNRKAWTEMSYWGSEAGRELFVDTNAGESRQLMEVRVAPVPAGTKQDPGVQGCISGKSMRCNPEWDFDHTFWEETSVSLAVNSPVALQVYDCQVLLANDLCSNDPFLFSETTLDVFITTDLTISKEKLDTDGAINGVALYMDTGGTPVTGTVRKIVSSSTSNLGVTFPEGFSAIDRRAVMDCDVDECEFQGDPNHGNDRRWDPERFLGVMVCPEATRLAVFAGAIAGTLHFEDDYCPPPRIDSIVSAASGGPVALAPGQEDAMIQIRGRNFAPVRCSGDWPPCPGPSLAFLEGVFADGSVAPVEGTVQWVSHELVELKVTVSPRAAPGPRSLKMVNPVEGAGSDVCVGCLTVREPPAP